MVWYFYTLIEFQRSKTLIRKLLKEKSDLGLHWLPKPKIWVHNSVHKDIILAANHKVTDLYFCSHVASDNLEKMFLQHLVSTFTLMNSLP